MTIDLVPLSQLSERYRAGWRLVDGYELSASDYAATMASPDHKQTWKPNKSRAAISRNIARYQPEEVARFQKPKQSAIATASSERIEILEEENRQLKERIAKLSGHDDAEALQFLFGLTPTESQILALLVHRGSADYDQLELVSLPDDRGDRVEDINGAIRSHIKRIRRKVRPHGIDLTTVYEFGYTMSDEMRRATREMIAGWRARFA